MKSISSKAASIILVFISFLAFLALIWLIYFQRPVETSLMFVKHLPAFNAFMNGLSTLCIVLGVYWVKNQAIDKHKLAMLVAFGCSTFFLIGYVIYHFFHGDRPFLAHGWIRPIYFFVLISHIIPFFS